METLISTRFHSLMENETYSWDEMEHRGWIYRGVIMQNDEILELWEQADFTALVTLDGVIVSIQLRSKVINEILTKCNKSGTTGN